MRTAIFRDCDITTPPCNFEHAMPDYAVPDIRDCVIRSAFIGSRGRKIYFDTSHCNYYAY